MSGQATSGTKARITIIAPATKQGTGGKGPTEGEFDVQFNPKEYSISKSADWKSTASTGSTPGPMPEFQGGKARELSVDLFFDATDEETPEKMETAIDLLYTCCTPTPKTKGQKKPSAPFVRFEWGNLSFTGNVSQVSIKYTMFTAQGRAVRATCSLKLSEIPTPATSSGKKHNPTSGALAAADSHRVVAGDTLASIAHAEYGDPTVWRVIADANRIEDPLRLREGTVLLLPAPDVASVN